MSEKDFGKIENIRIPNRDVSGWLQVLREGGFTNQEIDAILSHNNAEYAVNSGALERALEEIDRATEKKRGRGLSSEEVEYFKKALKVRFDVEDSEEKEK